MRDLPGSWLPPHPCERKSNASRATVKTFDAAGVLESVIDIPVEVAFRTLGGV